MSGDMYRHLSITSIGYSHVRLGKPCQDFSSSYSDGERTVLTACDGHGGDLYIRSQRGSKLAALAAHSVLLGVDPHLFQAYSEPEIEHKLKLEILCKWNRLVERDLARRPLRKRELACLTEREREALRQNPLKAYGSTLGAAMRLGNRLVCVGLGDGGCFLLKDGAILSAFLDGEEEPVANVTHSLCGENAFSHMHARIFDMRRYDGVLLCTDGVLSPYQTIENFRRAFVRPVVCRVLEGKSDEVKSFVGTLGIQSGVGDDVSLALLLKNKTKPKRYQ